MNGRRRERREGGCGGLVVVVQTCDIDVEMFVCVEVGGRQEAKGKDGKGRRGEARRVEDRGGEGVVWCGVVLVKTLWLE